MPRYLRKNHATQSFGQLVFWDTETTPTKTDNPFVKFHKLRLGVARTVRRERGKLTRRKELRYTSNKEFWEWILQLTNETRPLYMFAHNVGFDLTISEFWKELDSGTLILSERSESSCEDKSRKRSNSFSGCFCDNDPPTIISVMNPLNRGKITILDSMNYYRHSLAKIGDKLGIPKSAMPDWGASDDEWFDYCQRDVVVLEQAILGLMDWFQDQDYGNFKLTQASLSMSAFRHRFYKHPIDLERKPEYDNIERASYFGGRLELFRRGRMPGTTYQLDVVSQYPAVMHNNCFPVERCGTSSQSEIRITPNNVTREHIARVKVRTSVSRYPLRELRMGTIYPVGDFITTLAGPELIQAKQRGDLLEVFEWSRYKLKPVFREFVDHFWEKRKQAKKANDETESYFLKILMNSLYGKFAQMTPEWQDVGTFDELPNWVQSWFEDDLSGDYTRLVDKSAPNYFLHINGDTSKRVKYRTIGSHIQKSVKREPHKNSFCAISAYVTSYARVMLDRLMEIAGRENCYYVVTDSIFTNFEGLRRLRNREQVRPGTLGKLDIEHSGSGAEFCSIHHWSLAGKRKFGSKTSRGTPCCPSCSIPYDDDSEILPIYRNPQCELGVIETKFSGIRGVLRADDKSGIRVEQFTKRFSREYKRGIDTGNGVIRPLRYTVQGGKNVCLDSPDKMV